MARLILLHGLGADERLFEGLGELCLPVVCPRLPLPLPRESLTAYALRVAAGIELRPEDWIGGASFGGLLAADIARRRPVAGLVLIGGALTSETVTSVPRWLGRAAPLLPARLVRPWLARPAMLSLAFAPAGAPQLRRLGEMLAATPDAMLRRGGRLVTGYFPRTPVLCPVHAIHGGADRLMRAPPLPRCRIVPRAGHALALTHAAEVTAFLREILCR